MKIRFSRHYAERQKLRSIPDDLAETILIKADGHFRNGVTGWLIAVKRLVFQGKERDMALTYTRMGDEVILITLHPLKEGQKERRVDSRRWIPHES